jgi:gamma-glutamylaminecyclotransferase
VKHLLFVYGSLRPGAAYHELLAGARYLGRHRTEPRFTMYDLGEYPGVVEHGQHAIVGDVFAVDAVTLARIDEYEGYPYEYTRRLVTTPFGSAWIYLYCRDCAGTVVIASGEWRSK